MAKNKKKKRNKQNMQNTQARARRLDKASVLSKLTEDVIGQDDFLKEMLDALELSLDRVAAINRGISADDLPRSGGFVVMAPTGSGKTYGMRRLFEILKLESFVINSAELTGSGWAGGDIDKALADVAKWQEENPALPCVVIFDEADKLVKTPDHADKSFDPSRALLKYLEPGRHKLGEDGCIDADHIIYIFLGAFSDIENIVRERLNSELNTESSESASDASIKSGRKELSDVELRAQVTIEDLYKWNFPKELCGRMGTIINMPELSLEALCTILNGPQASSVIRRFNNQYWYENEHSLFALSDAATEQIAWKAFVLKHGARGLEPEFGKLVSKVRDEQFEDPSISHVVIDVYEDDFVYKYSCSLSDGATADVSSENDSIEELTPDQSSEVAHDRAIVGSLMKREADEAAPESESKREQELCPALASLNFLPAALTTEGISLLINHLFALGWGRAENSKNNMNLYRRVCEFAEIVLYSSLYWICKTGLSSELIEETVDFGSSSISRLFFDSFFNKNAEKVDEIISTLMLQVTDKVSIYVPLESICFYNGYMTDMEKHALTLAKDFFSREKSERLAIIETAIDVVDVLNQEEFAAGCIFYELSRVNDVCRENSRRAARSEKSYAV